MPVTKLPVVHKFGIISSSQRVELQERLLKQTLLSNTENKNAIQTHRNPLEVTEEFIELFNSAENYLTKEKYEDQARKLLERSKRRSGLKNFGRGSHVNLPLAWTEMAQLSQCKGRIQEECLDVLVVSLDVSPLEKYHIPALFFLAETMLYSLRTESVHESFLKTVEIKLLKMGMLVFERLFYHHMAGQLQGYVESKNRLNTYIHGLQDILGLYSPFPNALLSLQFIIEVGKIILTEQQSNSSNGQNEGKLKDVQKHNIKALNLATKDLYERQNRDDSRSVGSGAISSSVHDLSPTLWHALDVWRCTSGIGGGLADALRALAHCGLGLATETWIDGVVAIQILGEAAKNNIAVLKVLQHLAKGEINPDYLFSPPLSGRSSSTETSSSSQDTTETGEEHSFSIISEELSNSSLSDIFERSEEEEKKSAHSLDSDDFHNSLNKSESSSETTNGNADISSNKTKEKFKIHETHLHSGEVQQNSNKRNSQGSQLKDQSKTTLDGCHLTNIPINTVPGITGWHWEVAVTYTEVLANIVLHGSSSVIQKLALVGDNNDVETLLHQSHKSCLVKSIPSAGLLDFVFFKLDNAISDEGAEELCWKVRYGAIQGLEKICRGLAGDKLREGLHSAAWNFLLKANSQEKDVRILEALKIEKIELPSVKQQDPIVREQSPTVGMRIASGLSMIYLPPLPPPLTATPIRRATPKQDNLVFVKHANKEEEKKPKRTTLRQEIDLATALYEKAPDYNTRKSYDLRRVVEDQWRKELQAKLQEEEQEKLKMLAEKQKNLEEKQKADANHEKSL
ncbi:transmembrane protein 232-like [Physella acuta]|uniref:transmembrane protein 232-like n=1 Tax=Physella acuta TaxID=109671 RepID=UPI0027DB8941|nr:transmembrane protein 232-like [Physella acuta]